MAVLLAVVLLAPVARRAGAVVPVVARSGTRAASVMTAVSAASVVSMVPVPVREGRESDGLPEARAASVERAVRPDPVVRVRVKAVGRVATGVRVVPRPAAARVSGALRDVRRTAPPGDAVMSVTKDVRARVRSRGSAKTAPARVRSRGSAMAAPAGGGSRASAKDVRESARSRSRAVADRSVRRTGVGRTGARRARATAPTGLLASETAGRPGSRNVSGRRRSTMIRCCRTRSPVTSWTRTRASSCAPCRRNWPPRWPATS
ncbi:hypothetical protein SAMN04489713_120164 [Actinomadura madurae]|uniref:Secreted protein n=1 Tax=Actinomadura madurae TaxID=1993 RepID=A0A1I5UZX1_9ACTN|nr:hypothetical protein SAMN04489713_120164 [Actinomadura madurae]